MADAVMLSHQMRDLNPEPARSGASQKAEDHALGQQLPHFRGTPA
jgi:hypothetical protein